MLKNLHQRLEDYIWQHGHYIYGEDGRSVYRYGILYLDQAYVFDGATLVDAYIHIYVLLRNPFPDYIDPPTDVGAADIPF